MSFVVSFDKRDWGKIKAALASTPPSAMAAAAGASAGVSALPGLGLAFVDAPDVANALRMVPGVQIRAEQTLKRPAVHWGDQFAGPPPFAAGVTPFLMDDVARTWALQAAGISTSDADGAGMVVGVIDSGIEATHPDLLAAYLDGRAYGLSPTETPDKDDLGHGTHVAGVIAGSATPATGPRFGLAPRARLRSYRIYGSADSTTESRLVAAVRDAVDDGCHVIVAASGRDGGDQFDAADASLGNYAEEHGVLFFAAAGNESDRRNQAIQPTNAPSNAPRIYAVGSSLPDASLWNASNGRDTDAARKVDWIAPGFAVLSSAVGGSTLRATGTSVSAAVAAGIAAALWSRHPSWRLTDIVSGLEQLALSIAGDDPRAVGRGRMRVT